MRSTALTLLLALPAFAAPPPAPAVESRVEVKPPAVPPGTGDIYAWVDARGSWHFVDTFNLVPIAYRAQALHHRRSTADWNPERAANRGPALERSVRETGRKGPAPSKAERARVRVQELKRERRTLEEQLARIEEGGAPSDADESASESDLKARVEWLERRLSEVEVELRTAEAAAGPRKPEDFGLADDEI
jgi:hypothetical protein